jgi:hypothetical protein
VNTIDLGDLAHRHLAARIPGKRSQHMDILPSCARECG